MAGINFTRPAAQRIADAVRAYEEGSRDGAPWNPGIRLQSPTLFRLARVEEPTLPETTTTVGIYTGPVGVETTLLYTTTAYIRHAALHTGAWATVSRVDGDLESIEGGYALRPAFYDAEETWKTDENLTVRFRTGGTTTVTNLTATIPKWTGEKLCHVVYEADEYTGEAKWGLVSAETYYTRRGTYDASTAVTNGQTVTVDLVNGGGTVSAVNYCPTLPVWSGTQRDCVVSFEDETWVLHQAENYYTRRATYDASSEWLNGASATVQLTNGGGAVTAVNNGPSIGVWSGTARDCVVSYEDDTWVLHEAETYYVRRGTFSGEWDKNTTKTVTLTNGGSVTANNLFGDVGVSGETKNCAVAYEDGTWFLIAAECG